MLFEDNQKYTLIEHISGNVSPPPTWEHYESEHRGPYNPSGLTSTGTGKIFICHLHATLIQVSKRQDLPAPEVICELGCLMLSRQQTALTILLFSGGRGTDTPGRNALL